MKRMLTVAALGAAALAGLCGCQPRLDHPLLTDCRDVNEYIEADETTKLYNEGTFTRLHIAGMLGEADLTRVLLARGAIVDARSRPDGLTPLYYAALGGNVEVVKLLVDAGGDLRETGPNGDTLMHGASTGEVVHFLLARGAEIDPKDRFGHLPIGDAERDGRDGAFVALVKAGAYLPAVKFPDRTDFTIAGWALDKDKRDVARTAITACKTPDRKDYEGRTLLHRVSVRGWGEEMRILLQAGADVNTLGPYGTPLHRAVRDDHVEAAKILLGAGAAVNARSGSGRTPLHVAAGSRALACVELLIEHGADVDPKDKNGRTPLHKAVACSDTPETAGVIRLLLARGASPNAADNNGDASLHHAIKRGPYKVDEILPRIRTLLDAGAKPGAADADGRTPLHTAVARLAGDRLDDLVALLVKHGADANAKDKDGLTPLHLIARKGKLEIIQALLDAGAEIDARDKTGRTPLHRTVRWGSVERIRWLLQSAKANVNTQDEDGYTPLHTAVFGQAEETAKCLIIEGANVNAKRKDGDAPLHTAAAADSRPLVLRLVAAGADVNAKGRYGETPLHAAARADTMFVIDLLIRLGGKVNALDDDGCTPMDLLPPGDNGYFFRLVGGKATGRQVSQTREERRFNPRHSFYGSGGNAHHVVYVVDRSKSMKPMFANVRHQILISISRLRDIQDFSLLVLDDGPPQRIGPGKPGTLLPATDKNMEAVATPFADVTTDGQTQLVPALREAFRTLKTADRRKPGLLVYIFTDGKVADRHEVLAALKDLQEHTKRKIFVNVYDYGSSATPVVPKIMRHVAKESTGRYKRIHPE
jgi:ankyrin repeat protein